MMIDQDEGLSDQALQWIVDAAGSDAVVLAVSRLRGGMSSLVHGVRLRVGDAAREVVIRQFDNRAWLDEEPDLARHEADSLRRASLIPGLSAPRLIAYDETGSRCGAPAVLMTKLAGRVELAPPNMRAWLEELAGALARIHRGDGDEATFAWSYFAYHDVLQLKGAAWSSVPDLWRKAIAIAQGPQPAYRPCFIHRDYHPTNVLWLDDRVSGVVDWVNACIGPAGVDIGHCRINLAQLYGPDAADAFLAAYLEHAGASFAYHPYWDLLSIMDMLGDEPPDVYPGWPALGVTGLTARLIAERLDAYLASVLSRF